MLTPTVANRYLFFYAAGNTPATNLARSVPHGQDADILSLGCGDLRYILYTSYVQQGLPARKLDITCCDYDEKVVGRNIILLTLILDDSDKVSHDELWDIYYHLYVNDQTAEIVGQHVRKLKPLTASLEAWKAGPYASLIKICDQDTLQDVGKVCSQVLAAAEKCANKAFASTFSRNIQASKDFVGDGMNVTGLRSAAPLSLQSKTELPDHFKHYWSQGTVKGTKLPVAAKRPNPMFAGLVSANELLHYGTDPLLGYHLATAFADLSSYSPLKPKTQSGEDKLASAAQVQFSEWVKAFQTLCKKRQIVLRFVVSDVFSLCHTLQHANATGKVSANWYRRQWDAKILRLDETAHGPGSKAPTAFDVIETSNLSDHAGMLNIGVSAGPLLKPREWATIHTDQLIKRYDDPDQQALDNLLCGPSSNVSLLLGLTSFPYWTNSKVDSHVDEIYLGMLHDLGPSQETQLHSRLAWRRDDQLGKNDPGRTRLRMEPKPLARAVFEIYRQMFKNEKLPDDPFKVLSRNSTYGHFHRGSFVAFLKVIQTRVKTDWQAMCLELLEIIAQDRTLIVGTNFIQDLFVQLHLSGLYTEAWVVNTPKSVPQEGLFKGWRDLPPTVAVTLVIPKKTITSLYSDSKQTRMASPTFVGSLKSSASALHQWNNMYADVHLTWGKASTTQDSETGDVVVKVEQDELGWAGTSPLIASFTAPTEAILLEPKTALVGIYVPPSAQNLAVFGQTLGMEMMAFETTITNASQVLISRLQPGQTGNLIVSGGAKPFEDEIAQTISGEGPTTFKAETDGKGKITEICGHISISSEKGKKLLSEKVPIELLQSDPFVIEIVFGKTKLVCPLRYPIPVTKDGCKTRIARTSGYIEIIAPLAEPVTSNILIDYVSPSVLTASGLPVALNAPHINLDCLPILRVENKEALGWLTPLTSLQFSSREMRARGATDSRGMVVDTRTNFKESLFTMFMLASGLQGGQTGLFTISHPSRGGVHMLILVSAIRIYGEAASVVLDAAVIPLTMRLLESGKLEEFLLIFQGLKSVTIKVNDEELLLWKKILPAMAERCRTWSHTSHCEYRQKNATVPVSLEFGEKILCSCGSGKLPDDFVAIPGWGEASTCATRIAISPIYAVPFVEEVVDRSSVDRADDLLTRVPRCRKCLKKEGNGVTLKKCKRCMKTTYCSAECQKADWKKHKMECEEMK